MLNTTEVNPNSFIKRIQIHDVVLTGVTSCASIIGGCLIFYCHYVRYKHGTPMEQVRQFLLCLTFADMINAVGQIMGLGMYVNSPDDTDVHVLACHKLELDGCIAQSYVTTLSSMCSFFWTTVIALHLYLTYEQSSETPGWQRKGRILLYHCASWGIPFAITTTAASMQVLGSDLSTGSGAWCWISACLSHAERTLWMTISGKLWEVLMYFSCLTFYVLIKLRKRKTQMNRKKSFHRLSIGITTGNVSAYSPHEDLRFLLLWLTEVCLRIWGTIRYIIAATKRHSDFDFSDYSKTDKVFLSFQSVGDSAQAFCSFLLFCVFDSEMRSILKQRFCSARQNSEGVSLLRRRNLSTNSSAF